MKTLTVHSKRVVYPSTGRRLMVKALWVIAALLLVSGVVGFFANGFRISLLLEFSVPAMVIGRFTSLEGSVPHYENCLAELRIDNDTLTIAYQGDTGAAPAAVCTVACTDILSIEHSEQLQCFKLTFSKAIQGASNGTYHLLYMDAASAPAAAQMMEEHIRVKVQYLH